MLEVSIVKEYPESLGSAGFSLSIDLTAADGVTALFGPSGAGKTLTVGAIAGFVRPDRGRIALGGEVLFDREWGIDLPARKRRCGYLFQHGALFPHMTVRENLRFAARDDNAVDQLLDRFRIGRLAARRPHEISGGERQRCAIARTLATRPRLLLMDEPGQALDDALRRELHVILAELRDELQIPMILVTHDLPEAFELADQMLIVEGGRIIDRGAPEALYRRPSSRRTARLLGLDPIFEGRVVERTGTGKLLLEGPNGQTIATDIQHSIEPGAAVAYCVRPEAVIAAPRNGSAGPDDLLVRLERVEPNATRVRLRFAGGLAADLSPKQFQRYGRAPEWTLHFPEESVWVFPE